MVLRLPATHLSFFRVSVAVFFCLSILPSLSDGLYAQAQEIAPPAWEWHAVSGSSCRNGSEAGYFLRRNVFDQRLLIYLEGGGACFNPLTCAANPSAVGNQMPGREGIFSESDENPVKGWNAMYVPYCTGDIFTGNRTGVSVSGVNGKQNFVGGHNLQLFMDDLRKTHPELELIVLSGSSAGGMGAAFNFPMVKSKWTDTPVVLIDDSGFPLEDEYLRPCLQKTFRDLWGLSETLPADCPECKGEDGGGLVEFTRYLRVNYSERQMGMIMSTQDNILRFFFGFSQNDCKVLVPGIAGKTFEKGVKSIKEGYLQDSIKTFIVPGETHTFLSSKGFYQTKLENQTMAAWVKDLIDQEAVDRGPYK